MRRIACRKSLMGPSRGQTAHRREAPRSAFRWASLVTLLAVTAASLAFTAPVAAQDAPSEEQRARARALYGEGQQAFQAEDFEASQEAFEAAYREVPNPVVLLGVASAQERRGLLLDAARTLRRYLRERPDAPDRASVEERIAALDPEDETANELQETTLRIASEPTGASIELDDEPTGRVTPADIQVDSGTHSIALSLEGYEPLTQSVDVEPGTTTDVAVSLTEVPSVEEPATTDGGETGAEETDTFGEDGTAVEEEIPEEPQEAPEEAMQVDEGPSTGVWVTTGIAGAGLVVGTVFGFLALSAQSDFDANPTAGSRDEGMTFALVADLSFGVAVAAGITAIVLYATERSSGSDDSDDSAQYDDSAEYADEESSDAEMVGETGEGSASVEATVGDEESVSDDGAMSDDGSVDSDSSGDSDDETDVEEAPAPAAGDSSTGTGTAPSGGTAPAGGAAGSVSRGPRTVRDLELTLAPWGNAAGAGASLGLRF